MTPESSRPAPALPSALLAKYLFRDTVLLEERFPEKAPRRSIPRGGLDAPVDPGRAPSLVHGGDVRERLPALRLGGAQDAHEDAVARACGRSR